MDFQVKCEKCGKSFTNFAARASHIKWIHERPLSPPRHQCIVCSRSFRDSFALKRHVNATHQKENGRARGIVKCVVCGCNINKNSAPEHFQQHGYTMETETLEFTDSATFEQWKTNMEKVTNSKFVKQHGQVTDRQGTITNKYLCHRSGDFKSKSRGVRKLKVQGSNKIGSYCPAAIVTKLLASGKVTVTFQKTHVGHLNEVGRQWLTKEEKAEFASKIATGVPLKDILDDIGADTEGTLSRRHLTSRKDLHNISQMYRLRPNLNNDSVLSSEGDLAEESVVVHIEEDSNFVCKPQGCELTECDLEKKKASIVGELTEIVTTVQSDVGLEALERHIAPLQYIINSAEEKASVNFPQVVADMQEPAVKRLNLQRKFYPTNIKICIQKIEEDQSFIIRMG